MRKVNDPPKEDGHDKGAALTEEIHDTGKCTRAFAAYIHTCGKAVDHGKGQKKMGGDEKGGHLEMIGAFCRKEDKYRYDRKAADGGETAGKPQALSLYQPI